MKCWFCGKAEGKPVAFIETPKKPAFDACELCRKERGEALVYVE